MTRIDLERFAYTPYGTFGRLKVWEIVKELPNNVKVEKPVFECYTVERPWVENKEKVSCVPVGRYPLALEHSARFNRDLWELKGVPGRTECKIHPANLASQLEGCIAPGLALGSLANEWAVMNSATALERLMAAMTGTVSFICVRNAPVQAELPDPSCPCGSGLPASECGKNDDERPLP